MRKGCGVWGVGGGGSGVVIAPFVERRTRDRKAAGSIPDRSGGRIFFLRVLTFCCDRSTNGLPQRHVKDPGHSTKSAGGII